MEIRYDQRTQELNNLKLALATFALQLDAFESRLKSRLTRKAAEPSKPVSPDIGFAKQVIGAMKCRPVEDRVHYLSTIFDHEVALQPVSDDQAR